MATQAWNTGFKSFVVAASLLLAAATLSLPQAVACPFCPGAQMTLTEQLAQADAAVLVEWVGGQMDTEKKPGATTYQVLQVAKSIRPVPKRQKVSAVSFKKAPPNNSWLPISRAEQHRVTTVEYAKAKTSEAVAKGQKITLDRYRAGKPGDLFLLLGTFVGDGKGYEWGGPLEVSETSFNYIMQAPSPEAPPAKRLMYFLKFLEYPDPIVSNDAFGEFANAQYKDVDQIKEQLPKEKLRQWISNPGTPATRLGLYGMMIGLCGDDTDAKKLEARILIETEEFRLGIDGFMGGYLLLRKDKGLDVLDKQKLLNKQGPMSETFAVMQALRFMWTYGGGRISPERLQQSMRIVLDRPKIADLVIADLARWKDWTVQDKLMKMYGEGEFNNPSIKRAIVRYMLVSSQDISDSAGETVPAHALKGQKLLEELRKKDPQTVSEAERYFIVP